MQNHLYEATGHDLQILMSDAEASASRETARRSGLTASEWARRAQRAARYAQTGLSPSSRLGALDHTLTCNHTNIDTGEMLADTERGSVLR